MKKIFITYGDDAFKKSRKRIEKEAKELGIFDKIIVYTPKDLPLHIKSSPLMAYSRGGGYWCWKSYIIWTTLQKYGDGAVVFYADAGCTLKESSEWNRYYNLLLDGDKESIVFSYNKDFDYGVMHNGKSTPFTMRHWTKLEVINAYKDRFDSDKWLDYGKISGGFIIVKNKNNKLISQWYYTSLFHPEYFADSLEGETNHIEFVEHRHDQIILGIHSYLNRDKVHILLDPIDNPNPNIETPVIATRRRDIRKVKPTMKTSIIKIVKSIIGGRVYEFLHGREV